MGRQLLRYIKCDTVYFTVKRIHIIEIMIVVISYYYTSDGLIRKKAAKVVNTKW